jgi:bifunctional non-homologous end joining protein LigD
LSLQDIDPGEGVSWDEIKEAAFDIRDQLKKLADLKTVPLLTGGKGIHVIAPLAPDAGWQQVLEFTQRFARRLEKDNPKKYVSKSGKEKR